MLRLCVWFRAPAVRAIESDHLWTIRPDLGVLVGDVSLFTAGRLTRTQQDWAVTGQLLPSESQRRPDKTSCFEPQSHADRAGYNGDFFRQALQIPGVHTSHSLTYSPQRSPENR